MTLNRETWETKALDEGKCSVDDLPIYASQLHTALMESTSNQRKEVNNFCDTRNPKPSKKKKKHRTGIRSENSNPFIDDDCDDDDDDDDDDDNDDTVDADDTDDDDGDGDTTQSKKGCVECGGLHATESDCSVSNDSSTATGVGVSTNSAELIAHQITTLRKFSTRRTTTPRKTTEEKHAKGCGKTRCRSCHTWTDYSHLCSHQPLTTKEGGSTKDNSLIFFDIETYVNESSQHRPYNVWCLQVKLIVSVESCVSKYHFYRHVHHVIRLKK
jgi:hypothetical protein